MPASPSRRPPARPPARARNNLPAPTPYPKTPPPLQLVLLVFQLQLAMVASERDAVDAAARAVSAALEGGGGGGDAAPPDSPLVQQLKLHFNVLQVGAGACGLVWCKRIGVAAPWKLHFNVLHVGGGGLGASWRPEIPGECQGPPAPKPPCAVYAPRRRAEGVAALALQAQAPPCAWGPNQSPIATLNLPCPPARPPP